MALINMLRFLSAVVFFLICLSGFPADAAASSAAPQTAQSSFQAGVAAFQQHDYLKARDQFSEAIRLQPDFATAYSNRCLTYIQLAQYKEAIADCSQALALKPTDKEAFLNRGVAAYRLGDFDNAIADATHVLELTPHDPRAYYNRGLAHVEQGHYREALVDYGEALRQLSPLDRSATALIQNDRGIAYLLLQQPQSAIEAFTEAIQANGNDVRAFFNRGCAYHQQGNLLAALDDFTQATRIDPQYAQAYLNQGLLQHQLGEQVAAIASLKSAAAIFQQQKQFPDYFQTRRLIQQLQASLTALA